MTEHFVYFDVFITNPRLETNKLIKLSLRISFLQIQDKFQLETDSLIGFLVNLWNICAIWVINISFLSYRLMYTLCACICILSVQTMNSRAVDRRRPQYTKKRKAYRAEFNTRHIGHRAHRALLNSLNFNIFMFPIKAVGFRWYWTEYEREIHLWLAYCCCVDCGLVEMKNNNLNILRQSTNFFHLWSSSDECDVTDSDWIVNSQHFVTCSNSFALTLTTSSW